MQYQTVYRRIRLIIEPMGLQRPFRQREARMRETRIETERKRTSGTTERRNEYIARVCLPTYEVNIVTIVIGTALDAGLSFSLSVRLSVRLSPLPSYHFYSSPLRLDFSNGRDTASDDADFTERERKRKRNREQ